MFSNVFAWQVLSFAFLSRAIDLCCSFIRCVVSQLLFRRHAVFLFLSVRFGWAQSMLC